MALSADGTAPGRKNKIAASVLSFLLLCGVAPFGGAWYKVSSGGDSDRLYTQMTMNVNDKRKLGDHIIHSILDGSIIDYPDFSNMYKIDGDSIKDAMVPAEFLDVLSNGKKKENGYRIYWERTMFSNLHRCFEVKFEINDFAPPCHFDLHTQFRKGVKISQKEYLAYEKVRAWFRPAYEQFETSTIILELMSRFSLGLEKFKYQLSRNTYTEEQGRDIQKIISEIERDIEMFEKFNKEHLLKSMMPQESFLANMSLLALWSLFIYAIGSKMRLAIQTMLPNG